MLVHLHRGEEFLLLRRTPEHGGFWQGVTGAPEPGESDIDAAIRDYPENRVALERAALVLER